MALCPLCVCLGDGECVERSNGGVSELSCAQTGVWPSCTMKCFPGCPSPVSGEGQILPSGKTQRAVGTSRDVSEYRIVLSQSSDRFHARSRHGDNLR